MNSSWGFSKSRSTLAIIVSGVWNNFAKLGLPVLALALLALQGKASCRPGHRRQAFGIIALAASIFRLRPDIPQQRHSWVMREGRGPQGGGLATRVRRVLKKGPAEGWGDATVKFRNRTIGLVRQSGLRAVTLATVVSHLSLFLVLPGRPPPPGRGFGLRGQLGRGPGRLGPLVRLLTAIPITPGGLGVVELGLIGGLKAAGGATRPRSWRPS